MIFERIESKGLAHYSYLIGDGLEAAVIDPRRDAGVYVERSSSLGVRITHILETHRNEDYVIGSVELARHTGAEIWHADAGLEYRYGQPVKGGERWKVGQLVIEAIPSPGHTPGSMSYLVRDHAGEPWIVFTGDALFAGDVGRVDLLGMDRAEELAGLLHETIVERILPLGDGTIVCPAHGAGSVCGSAISDRPLTTIGIERGSNPALTAGSREAFIAYAARELERPPYFKRMEMLNLAGAPLPDGLPAPAPISPADFTERARRGVVLDTRMDAAYAASHVPSSLFIWLAAVPAFAGWFLGYEEPVLLVNEGPTPSEAVRSLVRLGYDSISGVLGGGMLAWSMAGMPSTSIRTITAAGLIAAEPDARRWFLDVRSPEEVANDRGLPGAYHIPLTQLPTRLGEVPRDRAVCILCGSGLRSMIAASILERAGFTDVGVLLGGYAALEAGPGRRHS